MHVQFVSNEKGEPGVFISMKDWEEIRKELKNSDFWDELPEHVKHSIDRGQRQSAAGQTKSDQEIMAKYSKYL